MYWALSSAASNALSPACTRLDHRRLLEPSGDGLPADLQLAHHRQQEQSDAAARLKQNSLRKTRGGPPRFQLELEFLRSLRRNRARFVPVPLFDPLDF